MADKEWQETVAVAVAGGRQRVAVAVAVVVDREEMKERGCDDAMMRKEKVRRQRTEIREANKDAVARQRVAGLGLPRF